MFVQVCGAAREVTGSCYLLDVDGNRFLIDCGLHQGGSKDEAHNFDRFAFDPREIDFVILTHAHIDHSGRLPRLVKRGFTGSIYATPPTIDLANIMLLDSAYIQEMESEWQTRKWRRAGKGDSEPLYTQDDARETLKLFRPVSYHAPTKLAEGVTLTFHDAGHILGSAIVELDLQENGKMVKVVFSGDLGQPDRPIIRDPETLEEADYLFIESTYGNRLHADDGEPLDQLAKILKEAKRTGGNVIIPSFAVGRTQELIYYLREAIERDKLDMPIYVDSPLASGATDVYRQHREVFDDEAWKVVGEPGGIFDFSGLHYTETAEESRALNGKRGVVIISASGMADAGRIRHHLKHNLWHPEAHVVIVGYQAQGSMGRRLLEGVDEVRIFGEDIAVKAHIQEVTGLSAHADQSQLLEWASHFKTPPRQTLVIHGEAESSKALADLLKEKLGHNTDVPDRGETFKLK